MALYIDDSIKKYFMSKDGAMALASNDINYVNRYLNVVLGIGTTDKIDLKNEDGKIVTFTPDNFNEAFTESNWSRLPFEKKAVICDWLTSAMMDHEFVEESGRPTLWFVAEDTMKFKEQSSYSKRLNRIYVNPKGLNFKGVESLRALSHETQHAIDDRKITGETLTNTFINLFGDEIIPQYVVAQFIDLDVDKFKDKSECPPNEYSKQDILLFKNLFSPIQPNLKNDKQINQVDTFQDFRDYMINSAYYASPMEMNAHKKSLKMVGDCIDENADRGYDTFDDEYMYAMQGDAIVDKCTQLENIIGKENVDDFVDTVVQMNFYKLFSKYYPEGDKKLEQLNDKVNDYITPYFDELLENKFNENDSQLEDFSESDFSN